MGLLDSPMWIDDPPLYPSVVPLLNQTSMAYAFMNATARLGDACAEYYFSDPYRCLFGQYRAPFITTPYLINSAQFDKFQARAVEQPFESTFEQYSNTRSNTRSRARGLTRRGAPRPADRPQLPYDLGNCARRCRRRGGR